MLQVVCVQQTATMGNTNTYWSNRNTHTLLKPWLAREISAPAATSCTTTEIACDATTNRDCSQCAKCCDDKYELKYVQIQITILRDRHILMQQIPSIWFYRDSCWSRNCHTGRFVLNSRYWFVSNRRCWSSLDHQLMMILPMDRHLLLS